MITSNPFKEMCGPLVKALAAMKNPVFDGKNKTPQFESKFATLANVRNVVVPILAAEGIALMQFITPHENGVCCKTRFLHTSGEWVESDGFVVPVAKMDAWTTCGASTYARRYDLLAMSGLVGDDDDDGSAANKAPPGPGKAKTPIERAADAVEARLAARPAGKPRGADGVLRNWAGLTHEQWKAQTEQQRKDEGGITLELGKELLKLAKEKGVAGEAGILRSLEERYGAEIKRWGCISLWQLPFDAAEDARQQLLSVTNVVL